MIFTIILLLIVAYFVKSMITDVVNDPLASAKSNEPPVQSKFVPQTLTKYNGRDDPKVYLAVKGVVFDVTNGKSFYGPGGPYENFAGRDASRGLAFNSFDPSVLTPIDQPLDTLSDLSIEEKDTLDKWEDHFRNKYKVVGSLHNQGEVDL